MHVLYCTHEYVSLSIIALLFYILLAPVHWFVATNRNNSSGVFVMIITHPSTLHSAAFPEINSNGGQTQMGRQAGIIY